MACIFCKIARGETATRTILEDQYLLAFDDVAPLAPVHSLVIPRRHVASLAEAVEADTELLGSLLQAARKVAEMKGIAGDGYRIITGVRAHGGQEVNHLHLHVIGGRPLGRRLLAD